MQGIQDNLDMLQQSQSDTVQQLAQDVVAALEDSESQLQVLIKAHYSMRPSLQSATASR